MIDVVSLRNFILTESLSELRLHASLIRGIGGGSTCAGFVPEFHPFLCETFFVLHYCSVCLCLTP